MINKSLFLTFFLFVCLPASAQTMLDSGWYLIEFRDKKDNPYSLEDPSKYLSERSILRRIRQGINLDSTDLPVIESYVDQVMATGATVKHISKWMNSVLILADPSQLDSVMSLDCVSGYDRVAKKSKRGGRFVLEEFFESENHSQRVGEQDEYGKAWEQTEMLNAQNIHEEGYDGQEIWIGVFDSGFDNVDSMSSFQDLRDRNGILHAYDMVEPGNSVYEEHIHGTYVLSTMAAAVPGEYRGMALSSKYLLFRTEDVFSETKLEEINWLKAAEVADSLGVDIINTSLTYKYFDGTEVPDYSPDDMDGRTSYISQASALAHRKGILCVTSAGNDGNKSWNTIGTPADTDSILAVGSVDSTGKKSKFSSFGPTADGRIKPDVMAMGQLTAVINSRDNILRGNGTSFSGPVLAGFAACVWSKYRDMTNYALRDLIIRSGSYYNTPSDSTGYGIPDYDLIKDLAWDEKPGELVKLFPNPFFGTSNNGSYQINVEWDPNLLFQTVDVQIYTSGGRRVSSYSYYIERSSDVLDLKVLGSQGGMYYFRVQSQSGSTVQKLIILN